MSSLKYVLNILLYRQQTTDNGKATPDNGQQSTDNGRPSGVMLLTMTAEEATPDNGQESTVNSQ